MKAVLFISHGSHSPKTLEEVKDTVEILRKGSGFPILEYAFLEIEQPSIPEGIDRCVHQGASEIVVLLNFLNSGRHVDKDIPRLIKQSHRKHPHVIFSISQPVGQHPHIIPLFLSMMTPQH